jgi:hypothetical protein
VVGCELSIINAEMAGSGVTATNPKIRDMSAASIELPLGIVMLILGSTN